MVNGMFCAWAVFVAIQQVDNSTESDWYWAQISATESVPSKAVLRDYLSLENGDVRAIQAFRSLFSESDLDLGLGGLSVRYRLFKPDLGANQERFPLVVWLDGYGEGELDEHRQLTCLARCFFPPPWQRDRYPFFLLSVLCPHDNPSWIVNSPDENDPLDLVMTILGKMTKDFPIDTNRISLVGASRGGAGCWELAMRHPNVFSAVAPLASRGGDLARVHLLLETPVWSFHSTKDKAVPIDAVRRTVDALHKAGGRVHLTEFDSKEHDAWTPAFDGYDLLNWLLSQRVGKNSQADFEKAIMQLEHQVPRLSISETSAILSKKSRLIESDLTLASILLAQLLVLIYLVSRLRSGRRSVPKSTSVSS